MNKETYKAYFRQRIDEKFAATETNVPKTPPLTRNKRKSMGVGSNFISGLRPAAARPATPQTDRSVQGMGRMSQPSESQTYYNHISALNKNDPYGLQRGFTPSPPTSEEQAKTPPV